MVENIDRFQKACRNYIFKVYSSRRWQDCGAPTGLDLDANAMRERTVAKLEQFAIMGIMTAKILKEVIERVQGWPEERQEDAAQVLLEMEQQDASRYRLTDAQAREVERIQRDIREGRGTFATDEELAALWKLCGL